MTALAGFDRWWRAPAPAARLAAVRLLVGGYAVVFLLVRAPYFTSVARFSADRFEPVGVVRLASSPLPAWSVYLAVALALALSIPFAIGWRYRITAPAFALALLWVTTYASSWAKIFHTEALLVVQVAVLAMTPAADALSLDARRRDRAAEPSPDYGWPLRVLCAVVIVSYLLAAVAKLRHSGLDWLDPTWLRTWVAYDNLRKITLGDVHSPIGVALLHYEWVFTPLAIYAIAVELGAPLAMLGRRAAAVWAASAIAFHWGVLLLMMVAFPYQMTGIPFAPFFRAERLIERARRLARRRRDRVPPAER